MTYQTSVDVAKHYAKLTLKVFPCRPDKSPHGKWTKIATANPAEVLALWQQHPNAMTGLPTGKVNGFVVLDIDVDKDTGKKTGEITLERLGFSHLLEANHRINTPSGGCHLYFRRPASGLRNSTGQHGLGPGLDIRGDGGYIIAAGSSNHQGVYTAPQKFSFADLPEFPVELLEILKNKRPVPGGGVKHSGFQSLDQAAEAVRNAQEGTRNATLNRAAFSIGRMVASGQLDEPQAIATLEKAATASGLPAREVIRTIESGLAAGKRPPIPNNRNPGATGLGTANSIQAPVEPQPLLREIPAGAPYPFKALGPLKDIVVAVQGMVQAPIAIPAQSALSIASFAVQGYANVETLGGDRPTSLYCMTIAKSGERKSSCDAPLMSAISEVVRSEEKDHRLALQRWEDEKELWNKDRTKILKNARAGNGQPKELIETKLDKLGLDPQLPRSPERVVSEPTIEGLTRLYKDGQPSLGIFSDEGGQFLGGHAMNKDNRQKTLAAMNGLWQGEAIRRTRQGDGSYSLHGRRLACHLMVQPGVAESFLSDALGVDTGFLPRFLMCQPESRIGHRFQKDKKIGEFEIHPFRNRLIEILRTSPPIDEETGALNPRVLNLSRGAKKLLIEYADRIEAEQAMNGEYASITGFASKSAEQAARIAGVLTLWEDLGASEIPDQYMAWGIELAEFYLDEALRLANQAEITQDTRDAEQLRRWLVLEWQFPEVIRSEILQRGPNALRDGKRLDQLISILVDNAWLIPLDSGTLVRGKARSKAYSIARQN